METTQPLPRTRAVASESSGIFAWFDFKSAGSLLVLAFLGVLWMLRRILAFFLGKAVRPSPPDPGKMAPTNTVKDPVCGMYMDPRLAVPLQHKGEELFFCSEECRQKYLNGSSSHA